MHKNTSGRAEVQLRRSKDCDEGFTAELFLI